MFRWVSGLRVHWIVHCFYAPPQQQQHAFECEVSVCVCRSCVFCDAKTIQKFWIGSFARLFDFRGLFVFPNQSIGSVNKNKEEGKKKVIKRIWLIFAQDVVRIATG